MYMGGGWVHASVRSPEGLSLKKAKGGRGRIGNVHGPSNGAGALKTSVWHALTFYLMGEMTIWQLERRGWGDGGQHGGRAWGRQILTHPAVGLQSKSYKHHIYIQGG